MAVRGHGSSTLKIPPDRLSAQLSKELLPVYLVSGDEPLLAGEAADLIRARAREAGYTEREVHFIERGTNWDDIRGATGNMSLFAARKIVELRMPTGKPGTAGAKVLQALLERGDADTLLLVLTGRLERDTLHSEWVRGIESRGGWVAVQPVTAQRLPEWLRERCRRAGLDPDEEAVALLAARTEGNLLAADQEIAKLALLVPGGSLDARAIAAAVADSARYSLSELAAALTHGDAARALRVLAGLRAEGEEPPLVLWSTLQSLRRHPSQRLPYGRLVERAARVDRMIKGRLAGDAWDELSLLAAEICGRGVLPLPAARRA